MNYKASIRLRNSYKQIFSYFALCLAALSACSEKPLTPEQREAMMRDKIRRHYASKYEWAVQHFEVGQYDDALTGLKELDQDGSVVRLYQNIPYYLGMSYYNLGDQNNATAQLERLLSVSPDPLLAQDAEIHLLFLYEKAKAWDKVSSLSSSLDKKNLYQNNRILMKLIWANSLLEQGELLGCKETLNNAESLLNNQPQDSSEQTFESEDSNKDLWGRYYFSSLKLGLSTCASWKPQEQKKKLPLYHTWLDSTLACYEGNFRLLVDRLAIPESSWMNSGVQLFYSFLAGYSQKIRQVMTDSRLSLKLRHQLEAKAAQNFYSLLHLSEQSNLSFEKQGLKRESLKQLQKQIDHLIFTITTPTSQ